jgi:peptidoglycan hydrolase-like protein with peptidoglycan-binding domain
LLLGILFVITAISHEALAGDCQLAPVWRDGQHKGSVCRAEAAGQGLTVVDLGDGWTPPALAPNPDGTGPAYRSTYLALAQERFSEAGGDGVLARTDRYLELFGIEPTLGVLRGRLADDARHACHAAIDNAPLADAPPRITEESRASAAARIAAVRSLRAELEHDRTRAKLADLDALAARNRYYHGAVARLRTMERYLAAVRAAQAHLACDQLFSSAPPIDAAYTWQTSNAIEAFQRGAMILPTGVLDEATRAALGADSRERDFTAALRVLRARVIAATGVIEDGTAGTGEATVLGRALEPDSTWRARGYEPLEGAAGDLVSSATEAAARALGWRDAASTRAFLDALASPEVATALVAVPLPPPPPYHRAAMDLAVEIDRGDVWHDRVPRGRDPARRPALILYALDGDRRIPLVRWPTTIGGWQDQQRGDDVEKQWKESPVGHRIWRDLFVGPTWLPPSSTPDRELVRRGDHGYVLAREELGPSYRAAFGFIAFVHLAEERARGRLVLEDQGIRTHGTGNLASLARGSSHGCHRLLGLHAVRLADFVLAHRDHVARGDVPTYYRRIVRYGGWFPVAIDSLGYRIELVPPIPVDVLPGRIHR